MLFPTTSPILLRDRLDVADLVAYLRSSNRTRPVAILTVAPRRTVPHVSADEMQRAGADRVDVVTIPTDALTHSFSGMLTSESASVYQGACRVYPPGESWETRPFSNPLRLARNPEEIAALPGLLRKDISTALAALDRASPAAPANPTGHAPTPGRPTPSPDAGVQAVRWPVESVTTRREAESLAGHLLSSDRAQPAVVVSRATGAPSAYADVEQLRHDVAGMAEVFEIATLEASWAFSKAVPDLCQVYGGASRVYPVGTDWQDDPYLSPLRFAYSPADRPRVTRQLVADVLGLAASGEYELSVVENDLTPVSGEVEGVVGDQALVRIAGQFPGVIWPELVEPGLPAERLFAKRMPIEGVLERAGRRIDVRAMRQDALAAMDAYRPDTTILARVHGVSRAACTLEPFPGLRVEVGADLVVDDGSDLRELLAPGDVVAAWFGGRDDATGEWLLSLLDAADPAEAEPAVSLLRGGPPWLVPPAPEAAPEPTEPAADAEPAEEHAAAEPSPELVEALRHEKAQILRQLAASERKAAALEVQLTAARTRLRSKARRPGKDTHDDAHLFDDEGEQLDFEIRLAWARTTQPGEKRERPLAAWSYGPDFLATLGSVQGIPRSKVVEVIVQVLTGRDGDLAGRELHRLRSGPGGRDPYVTREGGESCWRVSLQSNTPGARRLHYWRCKDGSIELSSVRVHDDVRP